MNVRDLNDTRIARLRAALETVSRHTDELSSDVGDGFTPLAIAQRLKIIDDFVKLVLANDERMGGKAKG